MFPLMGLLFTLFFLGLLSALFIAFRKTRIFAVYASFVLISLSLSSFCFFWGLGLFGEMILGSKLLANVGMLAGFTFGGLVGAGMGFFAARWCVQHYGTG